MVAALAWIARRLKAAPMVAFMVLSAVLFLAGSASFGAGGANGLAQIGVIGAIAAVAMIAAFSG